MWVVPLIASADWQLVWLLYLTSEEDTFLYRLLTIGGTGGLSAHSRTPRRTSGAAYSGGESGMGGGMQGGYASTPRLNGGTYGLGGGAGGYAPAETTPQKMTGLRDDFSHPSPAQSEDRFKQKAK
jgi:SHO1 osmosensor